MDVKDYLQKLYYDPVEPTSFSGLDKLWRLKNVKKRDVKEWLQQQDTYTLHKPVKMKFKRNKVIVPHIDYMWDLDLADVQNLSKYNKGSKYLLIAIDILSRHLWVRPLKNKSGEEIVMGLKDIFEKGRSPKVIRTDQGREFTNNKVQDYLKTKGVRHFTTNNEVKANYAERVIRTLRGKLFKYMNSKQSYKYIDVLQDLVNGYNKSYHRSIRTSPSLVNRNNETYIWQLLYGIPSLNRQIPAFKKGDLVRIAFTRDKFDRGYTQNFSDEIFRVVQIIRRDPIVYKINDLNDKEVKGTFYKEELQHVHKDEDAQYHIEKILKKRKKNGKIQYLVKWLGYQREFNSWIDAEDLKEINSS